ncbi:MAG: HAD-IA family hydrolase [Verrucomicrobiales bacterium]|nr:HAD-IA family hydrolase [Verrucomicrobiales bacterium]
MSRRWPEITAVTFDVGGTLIAPHPSVGALYARAAHARGHSHLDPAILDARFRTVWSELSASPQRREEWQDVVDMVFEGLIPERPSESFFDELYDTFAAPAAWQLFPDVMPALDALSAHGLELGIISNWDDRLRPLLAHLRLDRYVASFVVSCETGFSKPSPVIFQESLRQLGRPAASVLHIGDSLLEDFAGATAAGMPALHLRRDASSRDLQVQSLTEICDWIVSQSRQPRRTFTQKFLSPDG